MPYGRLTNKRKVMKSIKKIKNKLINILFVVVATAGIVTSAQAEITVDRDIYDKGYLLAAGNDAQDLANSAFAQVINTDGLTQEAQEQVMDLFNSPPKGVAFMLVEKLLGTWVGDLFDEQSIAVGEASSVTVITRVAGMTNILALVLGVTIIGYVILAGVLNTASSGQLLGKSWSSLWLPIRTALAFGLIMPMGQTGDEKALAGGYLSPIQTGVVYLALVGSNAGDMVWAEAINAVTEGNPIVATPKAQSMNFVGGIAVNAACGYLSSQNMMKDIKAMDLDSSNPLFSMNSLDDSSYKRKTSALAITWQSGAILDQAKSQTRYYNHEQITNGVMRNDVEDLSKSGNISFIKFGPMEGDNDCGSLEIARQSKPSDAELSNNVSAIKVMHDVESAMGLGIINFTTTLSQSGVFNRLYESPSKGGVGGLIAYNKAKDFKDNGDVDKGTKSLIMVNAKDIATQYSKQVVLFSSSLGESLSEATKIKGDENDYKKLLGQGGWATAGLWYFQLSKFSHSAQVVTQNVASSILLPIQGEEACGILDSITSVWEGISFKTLSYEKAVVNCSTEYGAFPIIGDIHSQASAIITSDGGMSVSMAEAKSISTDGDGGRGFSLILAKAILGGATGIGNTWLVHPDGMGGNTGTDIDVMDSSGAQNPFLTLTSIGHALNAITGTLAAAHIAVQLFDLVGPGKLSGMMTSGVEKLTGGRGKGLVKSGSFLIGMLSTMVVGALVGQGYVLAYGIPFIPVFIWTMLVIGWLVMIVEAIIAAPLAVILMATPEGEGISGSRMERAISLMAAVIMRPALSIMGLIASVTIAYLGFSLFNLFFWRSAGMVTSWGLFEIIAILTMYVTGALTICRYSFSLIYELPNHILEWMNGKGRAFGESEGTSMAQGAAASLGAASQQGFGRGAKFLGNARERSEVASREDRDDKRAGVDTSTPV
jgi:conjugal transfer/type IV secretion protein DotA/TraY